MVSFLAAEQGGPPETDTTEAVCGHFTGLAHSLPFSGEPFSFGFASGRIKVERLDRERVREIFRLPCQGVSDNIDNRQ